MSVCLFVLLFGFWPRKEFAICQCRIRANFIGFLSAFWLGFCLVLLTLAKPQLTAWKMLDLVSLERWVKIIFFTCTFWGSVCSFFLQPTQRQ